MSLVLEKAATIGFANFISEITRGSSFHYNRFSSHDNSNLSEEHSMVLNNIAKNILKYDNFFSEAYRMNILSIGQILRLTDLSKDISQKKLLKISLLKEKVARIEGVFSEDEINKSEKGSLIIDRIRNITQDDMDLIYLLKLNKKIRWDLLAKRMLKNNMYYLERSWFCQDRSKIVSFIVRMWASKFKKDFIEFVNSDCSYFSYKCLNYNVRETLSFALGTVNKDIRIARRMRSEAKGVSASYIRGLVSSRDYFTKEEISSLISNFSDTKYEEVARLIAENFDLDEITSMVANEFCQHILASRYAKGE